MVSSQVFGSRAKGGRAAPARWGSRHHETRPPALCSCAGQSVSGLRHHRRARGEVRGAALSHLAPTGIAGIAPPAQAAPAPAALHAALPPTRQPWSASENGDGTAE